MKNIVKTFIALAAIACTAFAYAHHAPPRHWHHHAHSSFWGHGGRNFWPGFMGGFAGSVFWHVVPRPASQPVVVVPQQTVVVPCQQPAPVVVQPAPQQVIVRPAPAPVQPVVIVR